MIKRWKGVYAQDTQLSKAYANKSFSRDLSPYNGEMPTFQFADLVRFYP